MQKKLPNFFCMAEREHPRVGADPRVCPNKDEQNQTPANNTESQRAPPSYTSPTTRRHLGFATKMPDEHFYKSIMNKCVFAWLSSRQARLFLYSRAKLLIIIRFTKFPCIFFPPIFPCFSPFYPFPVITPSIYFFLTIGMGGRCCAR